jgi:sRNA-binding carbon storage regulator CsrA
MLLLAHDEREVIILETSDGPIEIRLSRLDSDRPRIGIDAPPSVRIIRKALLQSELPPAVPASAEPEDEPWWHHPDDVWSPSANQATEGEARARDWEEDLLG